MGLYVYQKPKNGEQKALNKETLAAAETIRSKRQVELQAQAHGIVHPRLDVLLIDYLKAQPSLRKPQTTAQWNNVINHVQHSGMELITLSDLGVADCIRFRDYLSSFVNTKRLRQSTAGNSLDLVVRYLPGF